jgi:hypothetical protein
MLIAIFVNKFIPTRVKRRVNVDALDLTAILFQQQVKRLKVFAFDEHAVQSLVQVFKVRQQAPFEVLGEVAGVHNQRGVLAEKLFCWLRVHPIQFPPLSQLCLVLEHFVPKGFGHAVNREAIFGADDELLFLKQPLLEVLHLRQEVNDLVPDVAHDTRPLDVLMRQVFLLRQQFV